MRIVADTNVLIASIFWSGAPYRIVCDALDGKLEIVVSSETVNEVRKVLRDPKERFALSEQEIDDVVNGILSYAIVVEPATALRAVERDPKDDHLIAGALTAGASHIVTRDNDLLDLKGYAGVKIVTPEEFLRVLEEHEG